MHMYSNYWDTKTNILPPTVRGFWRRTFGWTFIPTSMDVLEYRDVIGIFSDVGKCFEASFLNLLSSPCL